MNPREAAWREAREEMAAKRGAYIRDLIDQGVSPPQYEPLPMSPPDYFKIDTGLPKMVDGGDQRNLDPDVIELPEGVDPLGRKWRGPVEKSPEEVFSGVPGTSEKFRALLGRVNGL